MNKECENINIKNIIKERSKNGSISCAELFKIVNEYTIFPDILGQCVTLEKLKISHCQLGLFGYENKKKIVEPAETVSEELEDKIYYLLEDRALPCAASWVIADELKIPRIAVAAACEKMKIKIKKCQLGAF
ncbi:MAG: hypothetical protein WDA74_09230 [Spirochaetota bacterium]